MALTQSARLPGPSWDEEVVPALRKRLESESRTLAKRMSAASLASDEPLSFSAFADSKAPQYLPHTPDIPPHQSRTKRSSNHPPAKRSRTYSQPYIPDLSLPPVISNGSPRPKPAKTSHQSSSSSSSRIMSSRHSEVKPTRIPKASRVNGGSTSSHGHSGPLTYSTNGYLPSPPSPLFHPSSELSQSPDFHTVYYHETPHVNGSRSTVSGSSRRGSGLLNEQAPFKPSQFMTPQFESDIPLDHSDLDDAPRVSNDFEERLFQHWNRGAVPRDSVIGEFGMGKRAEMLDIANYGHTIKSKDPNGRGHVPNVVDEVRRRRKRAESVAGFGAKERERTSLYLDEEGVKNVGLVLDESPLTDLDGESSDAGSNLEQDDTARYQESDWRDVVEAPSSETQQTSDGRSVTPTPSNIPTLRSQNLPPTRIPGPSQRRSSDTSTRIPSPTPPMQRGASDPPIPSSSKQPPQQQQQTPVPPQKAKTVSSQAQKRAASPASKKSRTVVSKANRAKLEASKKERDDEKNRRSVAHYPAPEGEEGGMEYAIPSWTQPITKGNWDEVVLPVVARKKGLDSQYQQADGNPRPTKPNGVVEPAPGTFGYKARPIRDHDDTLPDEFGRPISHIQEETEDLPQHASEATTVVASPYQEITLPTTTPSYGRPQPPDSPLPFSHYAPTNEKMASSTNGHVHLFEMEQKEEKGSCCCTIM